MSEQMFFEPTPAAAQRRLQEVRPADYAATRNHVDGAMSRLSPYITHGFVTVDQMLEHLRGHERAGASHKLAFQLGWREYFRHVWRHRGSAIEQSLHPGPLPDDAYAQSLPRDIACASTGLPVIDQAVRGLYGGWLHNHARLWLASYVVHVRRVHWRVGAEWMIGHLLDGDLASNHLSWQWVAGTSSAKPYLFNAENVRRHAPSDWHVDGTCLDLSYAQMADLAFGRASPPAPASTTVPQGIAPPTLQGRPPMGGFWRARARDVVGRDVWLVHPWSLAEPPPGVLRVGVLDSGIHGARPWSELRWRFVAGRMLDIADVLWLDTAQAIVDALRHARTIAGVRDPHLAPSFDALPLMSPAKPFGDTPAPCNSFSAWWFRVATRTS